MKSYKIIILVSVLLLGLLFMSIIPATASQKSEHWVLKFGCVGGPKQLYGQAMIKLCEWAAERSDGRLEIQFFPGGQLGNERDLPEGVSMGTVDMALIGASTLGLWQPEFHILGAAFIWKDFDHMLRVVRGPIGQSMIDKLKEETGIRVLDMGWVEGRRQFNTRIKPIREPKDIIGVKMRVPEVPIYLSNMKAMGASALAMNWGEVFTSLQTGVIDGQENPLDVIYENKFYEVTKYVSLSAHVIQNQVIIINEKKFQKMSSELQNILVKATMDAGDWLTQKKVENFDSYLKKLKDKGMIIIEDVDRSAFREKCKEPILKEWESIWGKGLYEKIVEAAQ